MNVAQFGLAVGSVCVALLGADDPFSDAKVTRRVELTLSSDLRFRDVEITVSTKSGVVTLQGEVGTFVRKYDLQQAVKRVHGVRQVVNQLRIRPTARRDAEVAEDIRNRLTEHSFLRPKDLTVEVTNGKVVLKGVVNTWFQKRQAEQTVREVDGVRIVQNRLQLGSEARRADALILRDVAAALKRDIFLADAPIEVNVRNGQVRLDGSVRNLLLRERASGEARLVPGVKRVDNLLQVVSPEYVEALLTLQEADDERVRENVYLELSSDPRVDSSGIHVSVQDRVVTLGGHVPTMFQRLLAESNARNVLGVAGVENELTVNAEPREDEAIARDVRAALTSDSILSPANVGVRVDVGWITLSGEVSDFNTKHRAMRVAARVRGVRGINNDVKVVWSPIYSDDALAKRVEERLSHHAQTRWVATDIQVIVKAGVVTLAGSVPQWSVRREAERVARLTDGVRFVQNRLSVGATVKAAKK